jgi:hypothetical protein
LEGFFNGKGETMNIEELSDLMGEDLVIRRYAGQNNRYMAHFEHSDTKDDSDDPGLCGSYGNGKSPDEAIEDYVKKIRGKLLIINAWGENRREYYIPPILIYRKSNP